jgi:hypothetical protein
MEKELVSFRDSIKMVKLGFNEKTFSFFDKNSGFEISYFDLSRISFSMGLIKRPTYSQCFRFFRENYNIHTNIKFTKENNIISHVGEIMFDNNTIIKKYSTYDEAQHFTLKTIFDILNGKRLFHEYNEETIKFETI